MFQRPLVPTASFLTFNTMLFPSVPPWNGSIDSFTALHQLVKTKPSISWRPGVQTMLQPGTRQRTVELALRLVVAHCVA